MPLLAPSAGLRPRLSAPLLCAALLALAVAPSCVPRRAGAATGGQSAVAGHTQEVALRGVLSLVWGAEVRYFLADSAGRNTELLVDEELMRPHGGPLKLDRTRVAVTGVPVREPREAVRVTSIRPDSTGR